LARRQETKTKVEYRLEGFLISESEPNYTKLLVKQLLFAGLKPVVVITGEGGIKKVAEYRPDLILNEAELSDMDLVEFISLLHQRPKQTISLLLR
jgi:DNA-binding response OmpR family regulator